MSRLWLQPDIRRQCCNFIFLPLANPRHNLSWQGRGRLILNRRSSNVSGPIRHPLHPHLITTKAARFTHFGYFDMHKRTHSANSPNKLHKQSKHDHDDVSHEDEKQHTAHSFGHSHSHDGNGHSHSHGAEELVAAFRGATDRGSQITLVGLYSNVVLTSAKGLAGVYMHSASLLADAAHSLSDLLGDFVTLFCWRLSRGHATEEYPYGFGKFETLGTTAVSLLLIGGALGIGFHSSILLMAALNDAASTLPPGVIQQVLHAITSITLHIPVLGHSHVHIHTLDPNAAWFAGVSVIVKEWLYRITKKVADDERSPVLHANALHHRSDAYSSLVAFVAIIGTWAFPKIPLDPIGGLLVSYVIFRQGVSLLLEAWADLTDASVPLTVRKSLEKSLLPLLATSSSTDSIPELLSIENVRARRAGAQMFVGLTVKVPGAVTVEQSSQLEKKIVQTLKDARKEISDVQVKFKSQDL